jgi:uncharacterized membrane protein
MPFCNKCGTEVAEGINFCGKCGNALNSAQSPSQTNYAASGGGDGTPFVMEKNTLFRIIGKLGYIFVIIGFCMPIACDRNGFQIADYMFNGSKAILGLLTIMVFVSAIVGIIIGLLLLIIKNINTIIDWITTIVCIASGLIIYLGCLKDDVELQSGAYLILIGWIIALGCQIISDFIIISSFLRNPQNRKVVRKVVVICIVATMLIALCIGYATYHKASDEALRTRLIKEAAERFDHDYQN